MLHIILSIYIALKTVFTGEFVKESYFNDIKKFEN